MRPFSGTMAFTVVVSVVGTVTTMLTSWTAATPAAPDRTVLPGPPPQVRLPDEANGREAVRMLGPEIAEAARLNQTTAAELRELLLTDRTAWVATSGLVHFKDPAPDNPERTEVSATTGVPGADGTTTVQEANTALDAPYPLSETFSLHSRSGSARTIFLDFDGHDVSGTYWNAGYGVAARTHPSWSLDSDPDTFSRSERVAIQSIWRRVAEDYAPFDVDVTTEAPADSQIARTGSADQAFGTRVLVSPSTQAARAICGGGCGGVAFLDVFDNDRSHATYQPAWVFPQHLAHDTRNIAEAISHEVGHNLALQHDGTSTSTYYTGHGIWASIMGNSWGRPISQWSQGQYPDANNQQDDVDVIASNGLTLRADEAGDSVGTAARLPSGPALITSDSDVDVYSLGTCSGPVAVTASAASTSPNLDIRLQLLRADGSVIASADPRSAAGDPSWDVANGMGATVSTTLRPGPYFVAVEGVGNGSPTTGYDGYGSLGSYTLGVTGDCVDAIPGTPPAPAPVVAQPAPNGRSAALEWSAPSSALGRHTGFVITRVPGGDQQVVPATSTAYSWSGLRPGTTYSFTVAATNEVGTGAPATTTVVTPRRPSAPRIEEVASGRPGGRVTATVRWRAPRSNGGSPVTDYRVTALKLDSRGRVTARLTPAPVSADVRRLTARLPAGRYAFVMRARNPVGVGPVSRRSAVVRAR